MERGSGDGSQHVTLEIRTWKALSIRVRLDITPGETGKLHKFSAGELFDSSSIWAGNHVPQRLKVGRQELGTPIRKLLAGPSLEATTTWLVIHVSLFIPCLFNLLFPFSLHVWLWIFNCKIKEESLWIQSSIFSQVKETMLNGGQP